jgi:hypothetical protein
VDDLLELIQSGAIRVPVSRRKWQWGSENVVLLLRSILERYPVGTLLLWRHQGEETTLRVGPHAFTVAARDDALWVVDGQQRVTALAGALIPSKNQAPLPELDLYFDTSFGKVVHPTPRRPPEKHWIPLRVVMNEKELLAWRRDNRDHPKVAELGRRAAELGKLIAEYEIPAYVMDTPEQEVLRRVLKTLNSADRSLSEASLLRAIHGAQHQVEPASLRELTERLRETRFGDFTNLLSFVRGSLLHVDGTNYAGHVQPRRGEVLARMERALRRVIDFLREEARIPHVKLVPYELTLVPLACFFDRHPNASARSRQLLARWIWRGAITGAHRKSDWSLLAAARHSKEDAAVEALLRSVSGKPNDEQALERYDIGSVQSKLETLLATLVKAPSCDARGPEALAATIANRIVHPPIDQRSLRALRSGDVPLCTLRSHGISEEAWESFVSGDEASFLRARSENLSEHIASYLEARAAWSQTDRPPLKSLAIADD